MRRNGLKRRVKKVLTAENFASALIHAKALEIRDPNRGEMPVRCYENFLSPGLVRLENIINHRSLANLIFKALALKVAEVAPDIDFVAGSADCGIIPGWEFSRYLGIALKKEVPFVYLRNDGDIVGLSHRCIQEGDRAVVFYHVINSSGITRRNTRILRNLGYEVANAACAIFFGHHFAREKLRDEKIEVTQFLLLEDILLEAEKCTFFSTDQIRNFREFLADPCSWQKSNS